jgi:cytochrome P450
MLNEMAKLTAKIIGRTIFGDETTDGEAAQVVSGFTEYQRNIEHLKISDFTGVQYLRWITNPLKKHRSQQAIAEVQEVIDRIISRQKIQKKSARFNLVSYLLADSTRQNETKCPMDLVAARNEAIVMFMAGHETTANSLAWTWYLLNHSPRVGEKLRQELDSVLGGRHATLDDVANLPYTRAIFEESLRLYPPVPVLSRESREEDVIRKKQVAKGTIMLVVPWLLHRHELFWENPNHFIPERFLGETRPDKFVYLPFSVGRRVCLGLRFGLSEGIICLANLAQRFEASLKPGHEVEIECRLTLRPKGGLPMQLKRRKECQS